METPAAPKQRSPWLYVLAGCGGLAALLCLGTMVVMFGIGKAVKDVTDGITDPKERDANAKKQLGEVPAGYHVQASVGMFFMDTTVLTDQPDLPDGGFAELELGKHRFMYFRVMANENNKKARDFFDGSGDAKGLSQTAVNIDTKDIVKRGTLTIDGRKIPWVLTRGSVNTNNGAGAEGLNATVLFECPGDDLHFAIWTQPDPNPDQETAELDLAGTVGDEAELSRFLKPINPCKK